MKAISVWVIIAVALLEDFLAAFLGGGAGLFACRRWFMFLEFLRTAVGNDLFELLSRPLRNLHARDQGNVDIMIALVMHTGGLSARKSVQLDAIFCRTQNPARFRATAVDGAAIAFIL